MSNIIMIIILLVQNSLYSNSNTKPHTSPSPQPNITGHINTEHTYPHNVDGCVTTISCWVIDLIDHQFHIHPTRTLRASNHQWRLQRHLAGHACMHGNARTLISRQRRCVHTETNRRLRLGWGPGWDGMWSSNSQPPDKRQLFLHVPYTIFTNAVP